MRKLNAEIRKTDIENRRNYVWANIAAFGIVALMAMFLWLSNGGAPRTDDVSQAQSTPRALPNG
ncbi:MAG: hypothetical protein ACXWJ6_13960 [Xanthobacteraceae bacterium]